MKKIVLPLFLILNILLLSFGGGGNCVSKCEANSNLCKQMGICYGTNDCLWLSYRNLKYQPNAILVNRLREMGFDDKTICEYLFDNFSLKLEELKNKTKIQPTNSKISTKNGVLEILGDIDGQGLVEETLFKELIDGVAEGENNVFAKLKKLPASIKKEDNIKISNLRSAFETPITGVHQEGRINNIGVALKQFDGMIVEPNEIVSFNKIVGETTKEKGYTLAKVIINGKYEDDYGGGVCQASTTLYNALLLADVEVLRSSPHSLKVGYVLGGFDAMVATGSSDLVFKNTTNERLVIATFCNKLECGVRIYGAKNDFTIKRISESVDFDCESNPLVASKYSTSLEYFKDGKLVKTKNLRNCTYYNQSKKRLSELAM